MFIFYFCMLRNLAESDKVSINTDTSVFTKTPKRFKNCSHVLFLNVLISQNRHVYVVHTKTDLQVQKHTYTHKQLDQGFCTVLIAKKNSPFFYTEICCPQVGEGSRRNQNKLQHIFSKKTAQPNKHECLHFCSDQLCYGNIYCNIMKKYFCKVEKEHVNKKPQKQ